MKRQITTFVILSLFMAVLGLGVHFTHRHFYAGPSVDVFQDDENFYAVSESKNKIYILFTTENTTTRIPTGEVYTKEDLYRISLLIELWKFADRYSLEEEKLLRSARRCFPKFFNGSGQI